MASSTNLVVEAVTNIPAELPPAVSNVVLVVTNTIWVTAPPPAGVAPKDFIPFATALLGALTGALAGFFVGLIKQRRDRINERHTALLKTQYALLSQWTALKKIYDVILPLKKHPSRAGHINLFIKGSSHLSVPFDDLTFLIDSDEPNLLQDIHIAELNHSRVIDLINEHRYLREEIQKHRPPSDFDPKTGKGQMEMPAHLAFRFNSLTDAIYRDIEDALPKYDICVRGIRNWIARNLKNKNAIPGIECLPPEKANAINSRNEAA